MNTNRIFFWISFIIILALIVWGLIAAMNKQAEPISVDLPPPITENDHTKGATTSPVTLMEYSDFQCPACESYYPVVTKLLEEYGTSTYFVYRHFPLGQHANAIPAALASEAAGVQGKFWEMYDLLFTNHTEWTELADPTNVFKSYATELKLDVAKFTADLASSTLKDKVSADRDAGINIGINSTPTFFVNGKVIKNPTSYEEFKKIIEDAASSNTQ